MSNNRFAKWRIFKCYCFPGCSSWFIERRGLLAVEEFPSGAEAIDAFARGGR